MLHLQQKFAQAKLPVHGKGEATALRRSFLNSRAVGGGRGPDKGRFMARVGLGNDQ